MKFNITPLVLTVAFFSVFSNALMLTGPLFMLQVYDRVLASRSEETLVALFALVAGLYSLYALFEFARGRVMAYVGGNGCQERMAIKAASVIPIPDGVSDDVAAGVSSEDSAGRSSLVASTAICRNWLGGTTTPQLTMN